MEKISTFLWFDGQAEEAAKFYASVFKNSRLGNATHYSKEGAQASGQPEGSVMTIPFEIEGREFVALNGGPHFKFSEAISFVVNCNSQDEVDHYWDRLSDGGDKNAQQCGWLKDKFGLSWQVVPTALSEMLNDKDTEKSRRVMTAMLQMKKIDLEVLKKAYRG